MSDEVKVIVILVFFLLFPVSFSLADVFRQKVNLLWVEFAYKRSELYYQFPWLESKWHKKKRSRYEVESCLDDVIGE